MTLQLYNYSLLIIQCQNNCASMSKVKNSILFQVVVYSDGSNYVRSWMFDCSKPKIGFLSSIPNIRTRQSSFNFQKKRCSSQFDEKFSKSSESPVRFEFNHQQMNTFEFVRCSKNDVRVCLMFDKMVLTHHYLTDYFCFLWFVSGLFG